MFYGTLVWDPWLIVVQIVCLQCLYYLTLGFFLSILVGTRVSRMSLVYFFDFATLTVSTVTGWCVIASFMLSALAGAGYLLLLIERAKKCLDFQPLSTLYISLYAFLMGVGLLNNMVGCEWYWNCSDGSAGCLTDEKHDRQEHAFLWGLVAIFFIALEELLG
ncbi:unnamed protein product [Prunus armeniaca]|uniref:Uncharacterized protein n=1 Tax=Prunus armeniaca TaxID=36596 RepID=A0A6J5U895_PRUAR|nr:unnamed protein product [Prunus armeniaca]